MVFHRPDGFLTVCDSQGYWRFLCILISWWISVLCCGIIWIDRVMISKMLRQLFDSYLYNIKTYTVARHASVYVTFLGPLETTFCCHSCHLQFVSLFRCDIFAARVFANWWRCSSLVFFRVFWHCSALTSLCSAWKATSSFFHTENIIEW